MQLFRTQAKAEALKRLLVLAVSLLATRGFAYQVWMSTCGASAQTVTNPPCWSNTAARVQGWHFNFLPPNCPTNTPGYGSVGIVTTTAGWPGFFKLTSVTNGYQPLGRSGFGTNQQSPAATFVEFTNNLPGVIEGKFPREASYGAQITSFMIYDNGGNGTIYWWQTNEIQAMRNYLDGTGRTNVGIWYDSRGANTHNFAIDSLPTINGIVYEGSGAAYLAANPPNVPDPMVKWWWTNSAVNSKPLVFQLLDDPNEYGLTDNYYSKTRECIQQIAVTMGTNFMQSSNVIFDMCTYQLMQYCPELASPAQYTNTITGTTLSLIEQRNLFANFLPHSPTQADADDTYRSTPPTIGAIANQVVKFGTVTVTVPFTVGDQQTPAAALAVGGSSSNGSLVTGLVFGGGGGSRTVTASLNPALTGSATICLTVSDGMFIVTNSFQLTVSSTATFTALASGPINSSGTWGGVVPVAGDTNFWQTGSRSISLTNQPEVFYGNTFVVQTNGQFAPGRTNATLTLNNLVLNGGIITMDTNYALTMDLGGNVFTLNSGTLKAGANTNRNVVFRNGSLIGNGTINITGTDTNGADVEFQSTVNLAGFTGAFNVVSNGVLNLPPIANATFGLNLSGSGKYLNDANVMLTSLVINGTSFTNGTYTYASFTTAQKTNLLNNGGIITVLSSNSPPTISGLTNVTVSENGSTSLDFTVGDANTAASNLVVSGFSSNPVLVPNNNIVFSGAGASRTVTITPGQNQYGTNTITVAVSDGWPSTSSTFNLNVIFTNYPPTISSVPNQTVNSNTPTVALFAVGDVESDPSSLMVSASSSNPTLVPNTNLFLGGTGANRSVKIIPAAGQLGMTTIQLTVSDGVNIVSNSFQMTVVPVNIINTVGAGSITSDGTWVGGVAPVAGDTNVWQIKNNINSQSVGDDTFYGNTLMISDHSFAPGFAGAMLTLNKLVLNGGTITMGNNLGMTMDLSGQPFTLNSGTLQTGLGDRSVAFQDGSLLGNGTINVTGSDTNGAAVIFLPTMNTTWFNGTFNIFNNGVLDIQCDSSPNADGFGVNISGTGLYVLDANVVLNTLVIDGTNIPRGVYGYGDFTFDAQNYLIDNGGIITVVSTNNILPVLAAIANQTLIAGQTLTITNVATDTNVPARTLTFSLLSAPTGAVLDATSGIFSWRPTIAQSPSTNTVTVQVADNGSPSLSATNSFSIIVNPPAKPSLANMSFANGQFKFTVGGSSGPDYTILASSNLSAWLPLWTNSSPPLPFSFTNATTNFSKRFYRVLLGP